MGMRRTICWQDYGGSERLTTVDSLAGCPLTFGDIISMSNAAWTNWHEGPVNAAATAPASNGVYAPISDMLACSVFDGVGTSNRVFCPAPQVGLFTSDENTADTLNPLFNAFSNATNNELVVPQTSINVIYAVAGWLLHRVPWVRETYLVDGTHPTLRRQLVWKDTFGRTTTTLLVGTIPMNAVMPALLAMSNAVITQWWEGALTINSPLVPFAALYTAVRDTANMIFADANGNRTRIVIPAPLSTLFLADGKTVDPSNGYVTALISSVLAEVIVPKSQQSVTQFVGGTLVRPRGAGA